RVLDPLHEYERAVMSLGGGAIETEAVRRLLFADNAGLVTIFLAAPLAELLARCRATEHSGTAEGREPVRPLLSAAEPPEDRLARRLPHYRRAHLTLDTAGIPPAVVVDRVIDWLSAYDPPHP